MAGYAGITDSDAPTSIAIHGNHSAPGCDVVIATKVRACAYPDHIGTDLTFTLEDGRKIKVQLTPPILQAMRAARFERDCVAMHAAYADEESATYAD